MDWLVAIGGFSTAVAGYAGWSVFINASRKQGDEAKANQQFWWRVCHAAIVVAIASYGAVWLLSR